MTELTEAGFEHFEFANLMAHDLQASRPDKRLFCIVRPGIERIHFEVLVGGEKYEFKHLKCAIRKYNNAK